MGLCFVRVYNRNPIIFLVFSRSSAMKGFSRMSRATDVLNPGPHLSYQQRTVVLVLSCIS